MSYFRPLPCALNHIPSTFYPIPINFQHRVSSIQHSVSSIEHPVSSIEHPVSSIQHRASSIQYPVSSIQQPVLFSVDTLAAFPYDGGLLHGNLWVPRRQAGIRVRLESTTTCGAGGLNFRPRAEKATGRQYS